MMYHKGYGALRQSKLTPPFMAEKKQKDNTGFSPDKKQLYVLSKVMAKAIRYWISLTSAINGGVNNFMYVCKLGISIKQL
ncbi:MAG: hypothetical protein V1781_06475 [Bacteroidota bacterium]